MTDWTETETSGQEPGSEHRVRLGFERETVTVALEQLVPLKILQQGVRESKKFTQIVSSIKAIGIVEAPAVAPDPKHPGKYFLLDGHLRIEALRQLAIPTVECLVANDDETYTYNKRVNRLPPSKLSSAFTVRLAMVAMKILLRLSGTIPDGAHQRVRLLASPSALCEGEPRTGLTA